MIERHDRSSWIVLGSLILGLLGLGLATPATAEWLVTGEGARIETKGPWKVKGNQVIFTLPNGTLSALRKSEVDLDASASASAPASAQAEGAKAEAQTTEGSGERRRSVAVFNNSNIGRAEQPALPQEDAPAEGQEKVEEPPQNAQVEIVSWGERDRAEGDGLEIVGTVKNIGKTLAANISVKVTVVDEEGEIRLETTAFMRSTGLVPGKSTTFRALLPGIFTLFIDPLFEVTMDGVEVSQAVSEEIDEENQNP